MASDIGKEKLITVFFNRLKEKMQEGKGAAAVEFALILPVLLLVIFAIIQFGILFNFYLQITHAAREGVRWAALELPKDQVIAKVIDAAPFLDGSNITVDPEFRTINQQGEPATVIVTYDVPIDIGMMSTILGSTMTLKSKAVQRIE